MEAEYIALYHASNHAVWVNGFMSEIGFPLQNPLKIYCDNEAAIRVASSEELTFKRSKHLNVKYHSIRDRVQNNEISVVKVASEDNLADQFTKILTKERFGSQSDSLGFEPYYELD